MNTQTSDVHEAKENLPRLIEAVKSGGEVIISQEGQPIARLSSFEGKKPEIRFGVLKGKIRVSDDFDAPLPDRILSEFE
ncbi:type II toxin-antitoxin system prevent-host-death family antitoxin [Desulfonatronospira sp.]|uniref:type II toxin-antitoxin system Phd/YefM family antitoxin n=1 Tax=Desulfonatronospira sp. TaxID=1962951 RepID=UPI0025BA1FCD|nr:type II toxin-antitoxin system prevent-host-death family antitoxin [Desulfonatronospira sp.]